MHAPFRHPQHPFLASDPSELRLMDDAESTIISRARAWASPHRLVVLGSAAPEHVERLRLTLESEAVHAIEDVRAEGVETELRRITMQHVPRGHMMVAWLNAGISAVSANDARAILRALRRVMWRTDLLLVGADLLHSAEEIATLLAGAAFAAGDRFASDDYSLTLGIAD